jgi:ribonucleoside-diphosphate reductase beta chain
MTDTHIRCPNCGCEIPISEALSAQIGLPEQYPGAANPFPWMSEVLDLKKEKNFFETRVTEYQTGGALNWD